MMSDLTDEELKAQRATRIAQLKDVMLLIVRRKEPDIKEVVITEDAVLDFFEGGTLDVPEAEWEEHLTSMLKEGSFGPADPTEIEALPEDRQREMAERLADIKRRLARGEDVGL